MRQVWRADPTARDLPCPRDLTASLGRQRRQEGEDDIGVCSPGHSQAIGVGARETLGSGQRPPGQRLLSSCVISPWVGVAGLCSAEVSTRRSPGWLELAPRFPCSGPHGHHSFRSGSAMLFQPLSCS